MPWRQWGVAAYRVRAWISGSRSGNLLLSLLWIRQDCEEREMSEQLGAKEATTVTEQSADWQKQVSCFFLPTCYCPFGAHTHMHTHTTRSEDRLWAASIQLQGDISQIQMAFLIDNCSRAASDRVSSGDQGEENAIGSECHHGKLTPHSPEAQLVFNHSY